MGSELSFVNATGAGCVILRETTGRYVVRCELEPSQQQHVATLAAAHAVCRSFEQRCQGNDRLRA